MKPNAQKEISLGDNKYFDIFIGERVLKKEVFKSQGQIPVYSANIFIPFGYLDKSNIKDFSHDYLLWGIDGEFGFNLIPKGTKFATTDHCGAIEINDEKLLPEYVLHTLRIQSHILGFDRTLRPSLTNMANVVISVPTDSNGDFDIATQKGIADKHRRITSIKNKLNQEIQNLSDISIEIPVAGNTTDVQLSEIFKFPETNSGMTQEFCQKCKGDIPVYGCSKSETAVLGFIKDGLAGLHYYQDALTWNRNGSVGCIFYRKGRFTTNEDHRVLDLKTEYKDSIFPQYIRFVLENEIKKLGFGFTNKLGKSKMEKIIIRIPIKPGNQVKFDYERQQAIVSQYNSVYGYKNSLINKLSDLSSGYVEI